MATAVSLPAAAESSSSEASACSRRKLAGTRRRGRSFGRLADDARLVLAEGHQHDLAGFEDRAHAHRDGLGRHVLLGQKNRWPRRARVTGSSVASRVRLFRGENGSLKPMCPLRPMPRSCRSMPPASWIACS